MAQDHEFYMRMALEDAETARSEGNDGVGSVIVRDGKVIAHGRNLMYTDHDPTAHAETVAIRNAGAAIGQLDLSGSTLYTTMEPCAMCAGAIVSAGISTVVLGGRWTARPHTVGSYTIEKLFELTGATDQIELITGVLTEEGDEVSRRAREERAAKSGD